MTTSKITTSTITLSKVTLNGYKIKDEWFMSLTGLGILVGKGEDSPRKFMTSKWLKFRLGKDFTPRKLTKEDGRKVSIIPIPVVSLFILRQSLLGNKLASEILESLLSQSLELRLEASLPSTPVEVKEAVAKTTYDVQSERQYQKQNQIQNYFQMWCEAKGLNPAYLHNYITQKVVGRTAKQSRLLPLNSGFNQQIGLDHYQEDEGEEMKIITECKRILPIKFPRKKKDYNYKNYADEVIEEITI